MLRFRRFPVAAATVAVVLVIGTALAVLLGVTYANNKGDLSQAPPGDDPLERWLQRVEKNPHWRSLPWCPGYGPGATPIGTPTALPPGVTSTPTPVPTAGTSAELGCKIMPRSIVEIPPGYTGDTGISLSFEQVEELERRQTGATAGASQSAIASTSPYSWAYQGLKCSADPCPINDSGLWHLSANYSTRKPALASGQWTDYHYYNRAHFTHLAYASPCTNVPYETFSWGIAKGKVGVGTNWDGELIVEKFFNEPDGTDVCQIVETGFLPEEPGAILTYVALAGGWWEIRYWHAGAWQLADTFQTRWTVAPNVDYGQEIWAANGDKDKVLAPLNLTHKVELMGTDTPQRPWHENLLGQPLRNRQKWKYDGPFHVLDATGSYVDIASCVRDWSAGGDCYK